MTIPSRTEILADLRAASIELPGTTIDERRAVLALEQVYKIREDIEVLRDEIRVHSDIRQEFERLGLAAQEAITLVRDLSVAEYSGEHHGAREKRAVLVKHGLVRE